MRRRVRQKVGTSRSQRGARVASGECLKERRGLFVRQPPMQQVCDGVLSNEEQVGRDKVGEGCIVLEERLDQRDIGRRA